MSADAAVLSPAVAGATVNADNPWPGLLAFRETDQGYFQGRQAETEELLRLVLRERLTVLFSLSGLGKSSLLQAGLFPRLRQENIFPVYIRLDFSAEAPKLVEQITTTIAKQAAAHQIEAPTSRTRETLWEYFHREGNNFWNARNRPVMPLLVFDQFEEVFTLGRLDPERSTATEAFVDELADLAECRPPAQLKEWVDEHPDQATAFNFERHYYKVLLSLREDFLADLDALRARMPTVALNRMRLRRMNGEASLRVVDQAQNLIDPDVAEQVVRFVAADKRHLPLADLEIEPALLSVVCRELNNRRQHLKEPKITAGLLQGSQEQVLTDFYERSTADLAPEVRLFVEDHLLTVSGFRDSVALDNALSTPGVSRQAIGVLVERRLVRREERGGTERLELTHDLLAGVVRASRDSRRRTEAAEKERAALLRVQQEQQVALANAKKKVKAALSIILFLLGITAWGFYERQQAVEALKRAKKAEDQALQAQGQADLQAKINADYSMQLREAWEKVKPASGAAVTTAQRALDAAPAPRVYMQIVNESDRDYAKQTIQPLLTKAGISVAGIQYIPQAASLKESDVRYYRDNEADEADNIVKLLNGAGITAKKYIPQGLRGTAIVRPNTFEVWLANGVSAAH